MAKVKREDRNLKFETLQMQEPYRFIRHLPMYFTIVIMQRLVLA